jgi:hypothetical protein
MNRKKIRFFYKSFDSYEKFNLEINEKNNLLQARNLLSILLAEDSLQRDNILEGVNHPASDHFDFIKNLLWFYRWLLSDGFKEFDEDVIDKYFTFIDQLSPHKTIVAFFKWAYPLTRRVSFIPNEDLWKNRALGKYVKKFDISSRFSEVIDLWLLYHIGLRQLFVPNEKRISKTMEMVLMGYIKLVSEYHELEEIFGVAIEKDLYRIHGYLWGEKND